MKSYGTLLIEKTMAGLHFDITGDNSDLMQKLKEVERGIKSTSDAVEKEGGSIEQLFSRMTKAAAAFGAGFSAKELIQNVIQVRGEFQQLEVAFTTMLGSQEKATELMLQLTETAAKTPFDLQGVANGARQLLAYGTAANDVNETLIRLGNIAAGLSIPLNDLVYLYGTTMTQGRLYTQDLNQFTGRGIPMIRELAKEFNVAESEIKAMVEAGKIGFPEVQKVIYNLTNEGGMFFNLMEEQSKTITGQISNIGDSFSMMLNEIGKSNEGIINDTLSNVSYLIENYEKVGKTLLEIVGTYGAYKAALITITALQKAYSAILAQSALNQSLAAASGVSLSNAQALAATRTKLLQVAQSALNKTMLANPYALVAASVAALGIGIYKLVTYQTEAEKAQKRLNNAAKESEKSALSEQRELARLKGELSALKEGTDEYNSVKDKIIKGYDKYYDGLEEEINKVGLTEEAYKKLTDAITHSFGVRQYEKYKSEQEGILDETLSKNLGKIQDRLYDELGDEKGSEIYVKIRQAILERKEIGDDILSILDDVQNKGTILADSRLDTYIQNAQKAIDLTEEMDKKARVRFGITDTNITNESKTTSESKTSTKSKTYKEAYNDAESRWKASVKAVQDAKDKSEEEYKKAVQEEEEARKAYQNLGGQTRTTTPKHPKQTSIPSFTVPDEEIELITPEEIQKSIDLQREAMERYLQEYGTYQQKKYAINEKYTRLIENATTKGEKLSLGKEWDKELTDLVIKAGNTSNAIIALFGDMSNKSLKELEDLTTNGQNALEFIKNGQWDATTGARLGITEEEFNRWQESPELIKQAGDALKEVKGQSDVLQPSFVKVKQGIEQFFNAGNDSKKLQESLNLINEGVNEIMSSVGFLSDTFSNLGDSFGGVFSGIAEGMNVAMDAVNSAMQGAQAGAMLGPIGADAGAAIGLVSSLAGSIAKIHDKKNEKRIERLQDQIDTLDKSYDKLGRSIEKAYSTDASKLIEEQNKVLEQQKILIQQQIAEEEDKKKTDNDRIKEWQQQIDEIDLALEDNKEKAEDVIFGEDIQSAIENFSSAYAEAWANGEDKAESAKETVKKMMQQMVTESIKAAIKSSKSMEEIRQKLKEFYADNVLTGWEQDYIYGLAEKLQHELDSQFGWADDLYKDKTKEQQSASGRGFGTEMTHEDAGELSGRFTAVYEIGLRMFDVLINMQSMVSLSINNNSILNELRNLAISSNGYLEDISAYNQKMFKEFGAKMDEIIMKLKKL